MELQSTRHRLILLDNGNVADAPRKAALVLKAMAVGGYAAVGTGEWDIRLGNAFAQEVRRHRLPLVRAFPRGDSLDALAQPIVVKYFKGRAIGTTAVPPPPDKEDKNAYLDKAVQALRDLRRQCDFLICLSQMGLEADKELARRSGGSGPHVIIGNLEAEQLKEPLKVGEVTLLPTGPGGVRVGMFDVVFPRWGKPRVEHFRLGPARGQLPSDIIIGDEVQAYYAAEQARFVKGAESLVKADVAPGSAGDAPRCGRCHAKELRRWKQTGHAIAMSTLALRTRVVPECVVCHSTRYRSQKVFDLAARAGSVDCTGCHVINPDPEASDCPEHATPTQGDRTCVPCHNATHSPRFNYQLYLPNVDHTIERKPIGQKEKEKEEPLR